ncbi:hypothetical protein [Parafilimonas sp.]|uniref:hypothetical protein n=1 Tax=Parafilimonas sp. TaxID=1969739 RepID=UPI0039E6AC15
MPHIGLKHVKQLHAGVTKEENGCHCRKHGGHTERLPPCCYGMITLKGKTLRYWDNFLRAKTF